MRQVGSGDFGIGQGSVPSVFGASTINGQRGVLKTTGSGLDRSGVFRNR